MFQLFVGDMRGSRLPHFHFTIIPFHPLLHILTIHIIHLYLTTPIIIIHLTHYIHHTFYLTPFFNYYEF